jgi:hypothetical protein
MRRVGRDRDLVARAQDVDLAAQLTRIVPLDHRVVLGDAP